MQSQNRTALEAYFRDKRLRKKAQRTPLICAKCGTRRNPTFHHILPQAIYGNYVGAPLVCLCREHHDQIELLNSYMAPQLPAAVYWRNLIVFLGDKYSEAVIRYVGKSAKGLVKHHTRHHICIRCGKAQRHRIDGCFSCSGPVLKSTNYMLSIWGKSFLGTSI